jgi:hypothetical protein
MATATHVHFKNIEATEEHKEILLNALGDIEGRAPENSVLKAQLKMRGKSLVVDAQVRTGRAFFRARATGRNLKEIVAQLRHNLLMQVEKWKNTRRTKRERLNAQGKRDHRERVLHKNFAESA